MGEEAEDETKRRRQATRLSSLCQKQTTDSKVPSAKRAPQGLIAGQGGTNHKGDPRMRAVPDGDSPPGPRLSPCGSQRYRRKH